MWLVVRVCISLSVVKAAAAKALDERACLEHPAPGARLLWAVCCRVPAHAIVYLSSIQFSGEVALPMIKQFNHESLARTGKTAAELGREAAAKAAAQAARAKENDEALNSLFDDDE